MSCSKGCLFFVIKVPLGGLLAGPDLEGYVMYTCQERFYCLILYWKVKYG